MNDKVLKWVKRHKKIKSDKVRWLDLWQYCGKYVHGKKQNFTEFNDQGTFLNEDVFDSTAIKANKKMAAALLGLLWQSGGKSMRIGPSDNIQETAEVKDYFDFVSEKTVAALDDPKAGLTLALEEYMMDQGCFGTSGVAAFAGTDTPLIFSAWGVDEISIEEGENGYVRTIYREFEVSILQMVEDYGLENCSEKIRESYNEGETSGRVKLLHIIAPRPKDEREKMGPDGLPYISLTIEVDTNHEVKDSGFHEMPVQISRFSKRRNEVYGRSPAMDGLPDILELNATKEARISAIEKSLDPPLGVYDDSLLGNEEIDTSAGGINVFATSGRIVNKNPIFPLFTVETIREVDKSISDLMISINEHFSIDRLLDFNNETEMTLGEAQMRQRIRSEALGSLFSRQQNELFTPLIERSISVLWRSGILGVIAGSAEHRIYLEQNNGEEPKIVPEEVAKVLGQGEDYYKITYLTPAARMLETAEAEGVMRAWEFALSIIEAAPEVLDNLNADKSLEIIGRSAGAPTSIYFSEDTVAGMRQQRAEQAQQQQELANQQQQMEVLKSVGEAEQTNKEAFGGEQPLGGMDEGMI